MIVVRLSGGLGNQMFQFAAGYALSLRLGVECRVDVSAFQRTNRRYELGCFAGAPNITKDSDLPLASRLARWGITGSVAVKRGSMLRRTHIFQEKSAFVFDREFLSSGHNSYIVGYFQSETYIESASGDI